MDQDTITALATTITVALGVAGAIGTAVSYIIGRRERRIGSDAQAAATITEAYSGLVDDLRKRVAHLEEMCEENELNGVENLKLREQIVKLTHEKEELSKQVSKLSAENTELKKKLEQVTQRLEALTKRLDKIDTNGK